MIPTWQAAVSSPPHCWRSSRTFEPPPEHSLPFKRFPHFQKISTGSGTWLTRSQYSRSNPALSSSSLLKEDVKKNSRMTASSITALLILNAAKISRSDSKLLLMTLRWLNDFSENSLMTRMWPNLSFLVCFREHKIGLSPDQIRKWKVFYRDCRVEYYKE